MSDVVERLLLKAEKSSSILRGMAEDKSRRQPDNPTGECVYFWPEPHQTLEGEVAAEITRLRAQVAADDARRQRLCALVMTDHRGDGLPTQEVTPDGLLAFIERLIAERDEARAQVASLTAAVEGERERCARKAEAQAWSDDHVRQCEREGDDRATFYNDGCHDAAAAIREGG